MSLEILSENTITGKNINDYNIIRYLSSGSFGDVYLAEKKDKMFAIKVFKEAYLLDEYKRNGENNRIKREIDIIKSISNRYLIAYEDDFEKAKALIPSKEFYSFDKFSSFFSYMLVKICNS